MQEKQQTLKSGFNINGKGLHSGQTVSVTIKPASENHGITFRRTDLEGQPEIKALAEFVTDTARGTTLEAGPIKIATMEHLLAALTGLKVDNVSIDINATEVPILDGSSKPWVEAINKAGIVQQDANREYFVITEKIEYVDEATGSKIVAYPDDSYNIDVHVDFNTRVISNQFATFNENQDFEKELSHCKTFVFISDLEILLKNNLIKGGDLDNAIIIIDKEYTQEYFDKLATLFNNPRVEVKPEGILNNVDLIYNNEPARHKLLDVIGDLTLVGKNIKGKIIATRPGHRVNTEFAKTLRKIIKRQEKHPLPPHYNPEDKPVFDIMGIQELLPHRPPFLFIDKITYLDDWFVQGIKNVTMNEAHFIGHFPEEAIMPGVLQIEAMAQCGAILLLNQVDNPKDYLTLFLKIENVRFKNKVVPGDTLNIRMQLMGPAKRGIAITKGQAFVGNKCVIEAEFMAQLTKKTKNK